MLRLPGYNVDPRLGALPQMSRPDTRGPAPQVSAPYTRGQPLTFTRPEGGTSGGQEGTNPFRRGEGTPPIFRPNGTGESNPGARGPGTPFFGPPGGSGTIDININGGNPIARPPWLMPEGYTGTPGGVGSWGDLTEGLFPNDAEDNEGRVFTRQGVDPRLDRLFEFGMGEAERLYGSPAGRTFFDGRSGVAGFTINEMLGQGMMGEAAGGMRPTSMSGYNYLNTALQRATNPGADPTINAAIAATHQKMDQDATDPGGVFSQIRGNSLANGSFGGSRQGVMEGVAAGRLADAKARVEAEMRLTGRGQNLQAAGQALTQIPNTITQATAPGTIVSGIGAQQRAMDQSMIDDDLRAWAYNTYEPDRRLDALFSRGQASLPLGGYNAGQQWASPAAIEAMRESGGTSGFQNVLGGVLGGLSIWDFLNR